jgi:hypothetical protein
MGNKSPFNFTKVRVVNKPQGNIKEEKKQKTTVRDILVAKGDIEPNIEIDVEVTEMETWGVEPVEFEQVELTPLVEEKKGIGKWFKGLFKSKK